jgi:hypothetical protein
MLFVILPADLHCRMMFIMDTRSLDRALAILATLAASMVALIVPAILYAHGSQDFFQTAHSK